MAAKTRRYLGPSPSHRNIPGRCRADIDISFLFSARFSTIFVCINYLSRENEGTERDIQGVGWDMSIPLKLFLVLGGNGSLFPQTSA